MNSLSFWDLQYLNPKLYQDALLLSRSLKYFRYCLYLSKRRASALQSVLRRRGFPEVVVTTQDAYLVVEYPTVNKDLQHFIAELERIKITDWEHNTMRVADILTKYESKSPFKKLFINLV